MRLPPTVAAVALSVCMLAAPALAAPPASDDPPSLSERNGTPAAVYQRDLACAATAAALVTRLPPATSGKDVQEARDNASRERTFAVGAGAQMHVPAPQVDRLIAQGRDEISARAEKAAPPGHPVRYLGIRAVECALDHLGDAVNEEKAKRAAADPAK